MFHIIKPGTQFDFVGKRYLWLGLSAIAIVGTIVLLFTKGLNYGIDFTSGAEVRVKVPVEWKIDQVRFALEEGGMKSSKVIQLGEISQSEYLIRAQGTEETLNHVSEQVEGILKSKVGDQGGFEVLSVDVVGPSAGSSLKKKGILAMVYALLAILIYVGIRFDMRYAPGAVVALFHDTVFIIGIFILTGKQFDLTILAAVLALIGYSNNDTIIVYDRVRETSKLHPELSIESVVNRAINETLARTILTSLTTFIVVFCLWKFGGSVIENFAFTLMVGLAVGTYSSVFIASTIVIYLTHYYRNKEIKAKARGSVASSSSSGSKNKKQNAEQHPSGAV